MPGLGAADIGNHTSAIYHMRGWFRWSNRNNKPLVGMHGKLHEEGDAANAIAGLPQHDLHSSCNAIYYDPYRILRTQDVCHMLSLRSLCYHVPHLLSDHLAEDPRHSN